MFNFYNLFKFVCRAEIIEGVRCFCFVIWRLRLGNRSVVEEVMSVWVLIWELRVFGYVFEFG